MPVTGDVSFCLLFFWLFEFQIEHDKGKLHFWTLTSALNWMWSLNIFLFDCIQREGCQRHLITLWLQGYPLLIKKSFLKKFWRGRIDRGQMWGRKAHCSGRQRQGINFHKSAFPRQLFKSGKRSVSLNLHTRKLLFLCSAADRVQVNRVSSALCLRWLSEKFFSLMMEGTT